MKWWSWWHCQMKLFGGEIKRGLIRTQFPFYMKINVLKISSSQWKSHTLKRIILHYWIKFESIQKEDKLHHNTHLKKGYVPIHHQLNTFQSVSVETCITINVWKQNRLVTDVFQYIFKVPVCWQLTSRAVLMCVRMKCNPNNPIVILRSRWSIP
jgi:hypothetical protein